MRLVTLAVAVMLLSVAVPAYAHIGDSPHTERERHRTSSYEGNMTIEDDFYAQAGWWGNDGHAVNETNGTVHENASSSTAGDRGDQQPEWLWIQQTTTDPQSRVTVTLETTGAVVGAIDVFKWVKDEGGGYYTPDCPQELVEELYPDQEEPLSSYPFRILHETVDYHQRGGTYSQEDGALTGEISVSLDPKESTGGFLVVIYPQAASNHATVADEAGDATLNWTVEPEGGDVVLRDDLQAQQPNSPVETNQWLLLDDLSECANQGVELPPGLLPDELPELPTSTQEGPTVGDLLDTGLPS